VPSDVRVVVRNDANVERITRPCRSQAVDGTDAARKISRLLDRAAVVISDVQEQVVNQMQQASEDDAQQRRDTRNPTVGELAGELDMSNATLGVYTKKAKVQPAQRFRRDRRFTVTEQRAILEVIGKTGTLKKHRDHARRLLAALR
jgi:hypothetical protein